MKTLFINDPMSRFIKCVFLLIVISKALAFIFVSVTKTMHYFLAIFIKTDYGQADFRTTVTQVFKDLQKHQHNAQKQQKITEKL